MMTDTRESIPFIVESEAPSVPDWVREIQDQGRARFLQNGIPTVKDEDWKYTNIVPFLKSKFKITDAGEIKDSSYFSQDEWTVVFVNGQFHPELSKTPAGIPQGVTVTRLKDAFQNKREELLKLWKKHDPNRDTAFTALNDAFLDDGLWVQVNAKVVVKQPLHMVHVTTAKSSAAFPRTLITMGEASEATVLESHISTDGQGEYLIDALTDVIMEQRAVLHYCKAQAEGLNACHVGTTRVWQERDSNFDGFSLAAGGRLVRNELDIVLNGEGSNADLNGLYSVLGKQHVDNHTFVDHSHPNCTSNQLYKGILNGESRAVFNGKILVRPVAQKTNSYQLNKNLLLGRDCRVDTKPQLEIFADDVKCTHGATIGQLSQNEIFYLQSRCIDRKEAVKMLSRAFINDILGKVTNPWIARKLNVLLEPTFAAL